MEEDEPEERGNDEGKSSNVDKGRERDVSNVCIVEERMR